MAKKVDIIDSIEIIGGLFKRIGNFSAELYPVNFDQRLIFQKTVYLLQAFGLYIGMLFSWYLRGPYSTILAKHGYDLTKRYENLCPIHFANLTSEQRFRQFIEFLGTRSKDAKWLETLASIHFLRNTYDSLTKSQVLSMVLRKQPYITIEECKEAWNYLVQYDLIQDSD